MKKTSKWYEICLAASRWCKINFNSKTRRENPLTLGTQLDWCTCCSFQTCKLSTIASADPGFHRGQPASEQILRLQCWKDFLLKKVRMSVSGLVCCASLAPQDPLGKIAIFYQMSCFPMDSEKQKISLTKYISSAKWITFHFQSNRFF